MTPFEYLSAKPPRIQTIWLAMYLQVKQLNPYSKQMQVFSNILHPQIEFNNYLKMN